MYVLIIKIVAFLLMYCDRYIYHLSLNIIGVFSNYIWVVYAAFPKTILPRLWDNLLVSSPQKLVYSKFYIL